MTRRPAVLLAAVTVLIFASLAPAPATGQCVSLTTLGSAYSQNFNTLSNTADSTTNNLTITGWFLTESGGGARDNEQYGVDTGASNTGDTYSYGAAGNTDRALGGLRSGTLIPIFGACFTNNTGSAVTSLDVAYTGEQWRLGTADRTDRINFEYSVNATDLVTGAWTGVAGLNFITPNTVTTGAKDGNAAANRTAISGTIAGMSIANGVTFWVRWTDTDASGADDGLAVDDFSLTPQVGAVVPTLSINDVTLAEGDPPGTTTFTFAVTLTSPAGAGGVTFDIATADGTATTADNDYVAQSLTGQSIPMGSSGPYNFSVTVNRDTVAEPNETFYVNVTNITGANAGDTQGLGTINNDDVAVTPIHDIQGPGNSSPIVGASVTTRGIVTGVRSNGFFIQEPDASVDADPVTSEGILVYTGSAPPAAAAVGNFVQVTGTVTEYVPSADPLQPPLTEITGSTTVLLSTGNPLPAPVVLTATNPDPAGPHDQLERYEGMRVSVPSLTVVAPTLGSINETSASTTSNGVFFGVVTGVSRPFREPGIQAPDPAPTGSVPPIPRFDSNPEVIRVDSDGLVGGPVIDVATGAVVTGLVGPLDYTYRRYTILPDPAATPSVSGGVEPAAAPIPNRREFTVASWNLLRFFDDINDPAVGEPVLTAAAFDRRLAKASLAIRDFLRTPDIVAVSEVENLIALQALAARIGTDAVAAGQPDPQYFAYLQEGNDVGFIDVGFLVKRAEVAPGRPRVVVENVVQELKNSLFTNADNSTEYLNDRPPLRLTGYVNHSNGSIYQLTVIVVHQRSMNGLSDPSPGSYGWASVGERVRAKRLAQSVDLANLIQARQTANATERIVVLGDFNAYEFNDGLVDVLNIVGGTPPPDNETVVPGDGVDLVNPNLTNLITTAPAGERYSYTYDGNAQSIDHLLVNQPLIDSTNARRLAHPRISADFPATAANAGTTPVRLSDHEPLVAYFEPPAFATADVEIAVTGPLQATLGSTVEYTVTFTNNGPDDPPHSYWQAQMPAGLTFASLVTPGPAWDCTTPLVGVSGFVTCYMPSFAASSAPTFTLTLTAIATGAQTLQTSCYSTVIDPDTTNNTATWTTTVGAAPAITSAAMTSFTVNAAGSFTVTTTGTPAAALSSTGALPSGVSFTDNGDGTATLAGTPAAGSAGTYTLEITAANGVSPNATQTFTLQVNEAPVVTLDPLDQTRCANEEVSFTAAASGTPAPAVRWQVSVGGGEFGDIPGATNATLTFFTLATEDGNRYRAAFTNSAGEAFSAPATLTVNAAPVITDPPDSLTADIGQTVSFSAAASGRPTPSVQWQLSTDGGGSFTDIGGATSVPYTFTAALSDNGARYRAVFTNGCGFDTTDAAILTINTAAPAITSAATTSFTVNAAGSFTVTTTGTPAAALSSTGALPSGVSFTDNGDGTATLAGTPAFGSGGSWPIEIRASNGAGSDAVQAFTLTVASVTSFTGPTATGTGSGTANLVGGGAACTFVSAAFVPASVAPPNAGIGFPHGLFDFVLRGCTGPVEVVVQFPSALPAGAVYWKYGPTTPTAAPSWYQFLPASASATATFTLTLEDNQLGDDDWAETTDIVDQGGPGVPSEAIPALSGTGLALLALLLGLLAALALRGRLVA